MGNLNSDWTVGFTDGEGSFPIVFQRRKQQNRKPRFTMLFAVSQKEFKIIRDVKNFFGFGRIIYYKPTQVYQFVVAKVKDLEKIRAFFLNHSLQTEVKRKDFQIWCKVLDIIQRGGHYSKKGMLEIAKLRDSMFSYKDRAGNRRYLTYNEIERLLGNGKESIKNYRWTEEEEQLLRDNFHLLDEELATLLKRTPNGIIDRRRKLGLKKRNGLSGKWLVGRRFRKGGDKNG